MSVVESVQCIAVSLLSVTGIAAVVSSSFCQYMLLDEISESCADNEIF